MMPRPEEKQFDISVLVEKFLIPVLERKWTVVSAFLSCLVVSAILGYSIKPEYVSEAMLQIIDPRGTSVSQSNQEELVWLRLAVRDILAQAKRVQGLPFCARVLRSLPENAREDLKTPLSLGSQVTTAFGRMIKSPFGGNGFEAVRTLIGNGSGPPLSVDDRLLLELKARIKVGTDPELGAISLQIKAINKVIAPILLQNCIDVIMAENETENRMSVKAETEFVEKEKDRAYQALIEAENTVIEFRRKYGISAEVEVTRDIELLLEMRRLESNLEMAKKRFSFVEQLMTQTRMRAAGVLGNVKVIAPPSSPILPSRRAGMQIFGIGLAVGLGLGVAIVFLLEFVEGPIRHEVDIENVARLPVLGVLPRI